ncbi:MAG: bacillithiol system redox-active protein YtxJ [Saprospiraceae bacterium]
MNLSDRIRESESIFQHWKVLYQPEQIDQLREASYRKPVIIFKHSTRCGISAHAKFRLESAWDFSADVLDFYYLDLIAYRPISNQIAEDFGITHQSPQIILLRNGKAVFDTSHHQISVPVIQEVLENS